MVGKLRASAGLSAAVYTQTTDVETECNGLLTYDRAISKFDLTRIRLAGADEADDQPFQTLVVNALSGQATWKYTLAQPPSDWRKPGFDDSGWQVGIGGFGTKNTPGAIVNTAWNSDDIWLRREFVLGAEPEGEVMLQLHHDEDAEIYLNGIPAAIAPGFVSEYYEMPIHAEAAASLKAGKNLMAVHCHQTTGGQYINAGLVIRKRPAASAP